MRSLFVVVSLVAGAVLLLASSALATPSGLNNIPTAEVVDKDVLVLQGFSEFASDRSPGWFAGFKVGPLQNLEVGLDDVIAGPGSAGGPTFQAKYRFALAERTALAVGVANIGDRARHGDAFPYAVVTANLGPVRGHLGYSWQSDNEAWFLGADGPVNPNLTLRADWIQVHDGDESVSSLGFIGRISPTWLVEGWASFPTAEDTDTSYTVKLDYVIPFGKSR
jgi:hypothetical protein